MRTNGTPPGPEVSPEKMECTVQFAFQSVKRNAHLQM